MGIAIPQVITETKASGAQVIDGSLNFNAASSEHLNRTPSSASNRRTWTWAAWVKRSVFGADKFIFSAGSDASNQHYLRFKSNDTLEATEKISDGIQSSLITNATHRDTGWYHLVYAFDSTQATSSNRVSLYVNGVKQTSLSTNTYPNRNHDTYINNTSIHYIGSSPIPSAYYDGGISQVYLIDGYALGPEQFGFTDPLTNTWRPKAYDVNLNTYVNNGTVWSDSWDGAGSTGEVDNPARAFNGDLSNFTSNKNSGTICNWVPAAPIPIKRSLRVYASAISSGNNQVFVNGTSIGTVTGTAQWYSILATELTSIGLQDIGSTHGYLHAVEVDGVILVDSSTSNSADATYPFGTNGFYLPMDGNSSAGASVGEDKSKRGNDWDPERFGNANRIDSPDLTGGIPILNTNEAGTVALPGHRSDPNASNLVVALPMVGGDETTDFNDIAYLIKGSGSSKAFTAFTGNSDGGGKISTRGSVLYGSSFYTTRGNTNDNSADYIERTGDSDLSMGTGDFCIEFWYHPYNYTSNDVLIDTRHPTTDWPSDDNGIMIYVNSNGDVAFVTAGAVKIIGYGVMGKNQDNHIALTRSGTSERLFVNGIEQGHRVTDPKRDYNRDRLHFGSSAPNGEGSSGYYNDLRVYKGIAKYTSSFKVGSPNPCVRPDTPSGVSGSSKLAKITDGAVNFDGANGTALSLDNTTDIQLGSGTNWTIEFFAYRTGAFVDYDVIAGKGASGIYEWFIEGFADGSVDILYSANGSTTWTGQHEIMSNMALNRWYHIALVRNGSGANNFKAYVDGKQTLQTTAFDIHAGPGVLHIGGYNNAAAQDPPIIISNFRIVNGSSVYTSEFTPPTRTLTNVTNTKLLCCQSPTSNTQATVIPDLENFPAPYSATARFGSYKEYTTVYKNVTSATTLPVGNPSHYQGNALDLSSGGFQITTVNSAAEDFFMGMWVHFDSYSTSKQFGVDIAGNYVYFETQSNGAVKIRHTGDGGSTSTSTDLDDGNWHHIALSRTGDTLYGFVDGTAVVSDNGGTGGNSVAANSKFNFWGADNNFTSYNIDGQIIDAFIYIGKGVSSYTNPNAPLVGSDGTINHFSGFTDSDAYYISPCVDVTGSQANSVTGSFTDVAGASTGTATNFNPFTTDINTVRGQESGYCTLNPLDGHISVRDNGLQMSTTSGWQGIRATHGMNSGKFYWETQNDQTAAAILGMADVEAGPFYDGSIFGTGAGSGGANPAWTWGGANRYFNGSESGVSGFANHVYTDVVQYAFDADNGNLWFGRNGVWYNSSFDATGNPATGANPTVSGIDTSKTYVPCGVCHNGSARFNFGQKPFKFPPPDGFQPINSSTTRPKNVIADPTQYVGIATWTADGNDRFIEYGMQPDLFIVKARNDSYRNGWFDSVRGFKNVIWSDRTLNETNDSSYPEDPTSHGIIVNNDDGQTNQNTKTYVGWAFKAGGSKGTFNIDDVGYASAAACGLDGGTITPTGASVGTKQGFSILKYSGSSGTGSISHGLSQAPSFVIVKCTAGVSNQNWTIYHKDLPTGDYLKFTSDEKIDYPMFNDSHPNSSIIPLGNDDQVSGSSGTYILYAWHDVPGLQKFGSYQGIDTDPLFVNLGFRPALLVIKFYDGTDVGSHAGWKVIDSQRNKFNIDGISQKLAWDRSEQENGGTTISTSEGKVDFLSNGFRIRDGHSPFKTAGRNYIYMAWAEAPQYNLFGGQSNAR